MASTVAHMTQTFAARSLKSTASRTPTAASRSSTKLRAAARFGRGSFGRLPGLSTSRSTKSAFVVEARGARVQAPVPVEEEEGIDIASVGLLVARVGAGLLMVHHGFDKIENAEGFTQFVTAKYFGFLPNPLAWTYLAAYTQIIAPVGLIPGFFTRFTSFGLFMTMAFATIFHLEATGLQGFPLAFPSDHSYQYELSVLYACIFIYICCTGGGKYSVDELVGTDEKILEVVDNVLGDDE